METLFKTILIRIGLGGCKINNQGLFECCKKDPDTGEWECSDGTGWDPGDYPGFAAFMGLNVGSGEKIYKGKNSLGYEQFRTLLAEMPVKVGMTPSGNEIKITLDEEFLTDALLENLISKTNSILISDENNKTSIDINPAAFVEGTGIEIQETYNNGDLQLIFSIDPETLNALTCIVNVGKGVKIYKGQNQDGEHELRTLLTDVIQPAPENRGTLEGDVSFTVEITPSDEEIKFTIDLSELGVAAPQQQGIPEYYVNKNADASIEDGSIIRPFKTWDSCKAAIIGNGNFANPDKTGIVNFMTDIQSSEDLTLRNISFNFMAGSVFTYQGAEDAVFDMYKIISYPAYFTTNSHTKIIGTGTITRQSSDITKYKLIRAAGKTADLTGTAQGVYTIYFENCNIILREKTSDISTYFTVATDDSGNTLYDGGGNTIQVLDKSGNNTDKIKADDGLITVIGRNNPIRDCLYIMDGARVQTRTAIQRAVYADKEAGFVIYGELSMDALSYSGVTPVRRGDIISGNTTDRYTGSKEVSLISINDGSVLNSSSNGVINSKLLGSTRQGGYNAFVEIKGQDSAFRSRSPIGFLLSDRMRYNYIFYIADDDPDKEIRIENIDTDALPYYSIVGFGQTATGIGTTFSLGKGIVEKNNSYYKNTVLNNIQRSIYSIPSDVMNKNFDLVQISTLLVRSTYKIPTEPDNSTALSNGLIPGAIYKTLDNGSYILKIVV